MNFNLKSDICFEAENLEDAFLKLERHFRQLRLSEESDLFEEGTIEINIAIK